MMTDRTSRIGSEPARNYRNTVLKRPLNFSYAGPFNEMVLLGVLAIRLQSLNKTLKWNAKNMQFTNISPDDVLKVVTSDEFKVIDGHPNFNTQHAKFNALEAANGFIKHTYRDGWNLPLIQNKDL